MPTSAGTGTLVATLPIVLNIALSSVVVAIPIAMVVLLLSSLTKDRRIATFAWLMTWIFGEIAFRVLTIGGFARDYTPPSWASLLSLRELTTQATSGIFDLRGSIESLLANLGESGEGVDRVVRSMAMEMGDANLTDQRLSQTNIMDIVGTGYSPAVSIAVTASAA